MRSLSRIFWMVTMCVVLILAVTAFSTEVQAVNAVDGGSCGQATYWQLTEDGTLTIDGEGYFWNKSDYGKFPWNQYASEITNLVIGDRVTRVSAYAFEGMPNLTTVYLGTGLQEIGEEAFAECKKLKSVAIPEGITVIEKNVFFNCTSLAEVDFSRAKVLEKIKQHAFAYSGVEELVFPDSLRIIEKEAFYECQQLTSLELNDGLEVIDFSVFEGCTSLTGHMYFPESLQEVKAFSFEKCDKITSVQLNASSNIRFMVDFAGSKYLEEVTIGGACKYIENGKFQNCTALKKVTFEIPIQEIQSYAFEGCISLKEITLPKGLQKICSRAFEKTGLITITIPNTVKEVGMSAFSDCKELVSVDLGDGLQILGSYAFVRCPKLQTVDMGNLVKLFTSAFRECESLSTIIWSDKLEYLDTNAFADCIALTSVTLPETLNELGNGVFVDCPNLRTVKFLGEPPTFHYHKSFNGVLATVYYPYGSKGWTEDVRQDYGGKLTWEPFLKDVVLTKTIGHKTGNIIYWNEAMGADLYQVYRRAADESSWTLLKNTRSLACKDESAAVGVRYYYKVRSRNGDMMSSLDIPALSAVRAYPLDNVKMTKIIGHKTGNIVYWEAVEDADLYQIYRRSASESGWTLIKNTRSLAYKDESAALGVKYYYKVRARNGDLMSSLDITALSAVRPYPLDSVKMTKAVGHATGNIIYWEAVDGAALYQVYRRAENESAWSLIKNTGSLAYKDTGARSGVKYYYKVIARDGDARSSMDITAVSATRP